MSNKVDDRKNIVVVGGGAGGALTARLLSSKLDASNYNLILIDPRPNFILLPASARVNVCNPDGLEDKILVNLKKVFATQNGTFIQQKVTNIEKAQNGTGGHLVLSNGERVEFHILVLAPGSKWSGPFGFPDSESDLRDFFGANRTSIQAAKDILLVGGGAVGIELAGEIGDEYPDKSITIIQRNEYLLNPAYPVKFRKAVAARLSSRNVNLIFKDSVDESHPTEGVVKTRSGATIKADLVLATFGPKPNTEFIAKSLGADVLTHTGFVKVQPTLQLSTHPEIFAVGDVVDLPEQKQLFKAQSHAAIVAANIVAHLQGRSLKPYKSMPEVIFISIGKNGGAVYLGYLGGIVLGDWCARLGKSRTLMIGMMRSALGQ